VLFLEEAGFPITIEEDIKEKFIELDYLKKSMGKTGLIQEKITFFLLCKLLVNKLILAKTIIF